GDGEAAEAGQGPHPPAAAQPGLRADRGRARPGLRHRGAVLRAGEAEQVRAGPGVSQAQAGERVFPTGASGLGPCHARAGADSFEFRGELAAPATTGGHTAHIPGYTSLRTPLWTRTRSAHLQRPW